MPKRIGVFAWGRTLSAEYLYLTTTGWKTGRQHEIEIWYVPHTGRYYLVAERARATHWVQNIEHNPAIRFRLDTETFSGTARIVEREREPELAGQVAALMDAKYNWSDGLIVELSAAT